MSNPLATPVPWDLVSEAYETEVTPHFEHYARKALDLAAVPPKARVVDVACGPGTLAILAAHAAHTVDALDFAPKMVERLAARVSLLRAAVTPQVGDGQALPYEDGTFAAGFSMFGLMFFPDRAQGFRELRRVLARGAKVVVSSWQPMDGIPVMRAVFGTIADALGVPPPEPFPLGTEADCLAEMGAAFSEVSVHAVSHTKSYESADAIWASMQRTSAPVVLTKSKLPPARWASLDASISAAVAKTVAVHGPDVTMTAWLTVGTAA